VSTHDLAVVVVSHDSAEDLSECLSSLFERRGELELCVVVADSGSTDSTAEVAARFPVLFVPGENHGFSAANNRALAETGVSSARYVLFLNPDTALTTGRLDDLLALCDARPDAGAFSVRQVDQEGNLIHSMGRFPSPGRYWLEASPVRRLQALGHGVYDDALYERETEFDWATASFLLVRTEVLDAVGWFDERFFFTSEEVDLCRRIRSAGWRLQHLPSLTVMHRWAQRPPDPWREWMLVRGKIQYAEKWFSRSGVLLTRTALLVRHGLEALSPTRSSAKRTDAHVKVRAALGLPAPPRTRRPQ
jgi:N-acetylglucosaminyl-diphospho-decaprenol L-rhamnosyltransferase